MRIHGKVAVVTGAASGIGEHLALRFAQEGAAGVVLADLDLQGAQRVAASIGERALALYCDVGREVSIVSMVRAAHERFGKVDIYFSNAGVAPKVGGIELDDEVWDVMWRVHGMAHVWAARAVLPDMLRRGEGYFLITASAAGLLSLVESAPYTATKHAAVAIAESLRIAYGRKGVRVSCLCPQAVQTGMTRGGPGSAGDDEMLTPQQVSETVVRAMGEEGFLILSHPETAGYLQAKVLDCDRWLGGMQKTHARYWSQS